MKSKINLELKYFCNDFGPIRNKLLELDVKKVGVVNQIDYFFNLPKVSKSKIQSRLKLRIENNKKTLIFYKRGDFSSKRHTSADITLYEVRDGKLFNFLRLFLGIKAIVNKTRERWQKENVIFNLDNVKGIGKVFEIEVETNNKNSIKEIRSFKKYKKSFLPYLSKIITKSNLDLILTASS